MRAPYPAISASTDAALGEALGLPTDSAALGLLEMVDENMANAAREHAVESGKSLIGRTMIAFGGCAPLHAARLAQKLGIDRILVPEGAGVGSAIGFLRAPVGYEIARSLYQRLASLDRSRIDALLDAMVAEARSFVAAAADGPDADLQVERRAYMRYVGQSHEIEVPLPDGVLGENAPTVLRARYDDSYRRQFGPPVPGLEIEFVSWSVRAVLPVAPPTRVAAARQVEPRAYPDRSLLDLAGGGAVAARAVDRATLAAGTWLPGPAVIVEDETTTVVPGGFRATCLPEGHILIEREAE